MLLSSLAEAKIKSRLEETSPDNTKLILPGNGQEYRFVWSDSASFLMSHQSILSIRETNASIFIVHKIGRPQFKWAKTNGISIIDANGNGVVRLPGFHMEVFLAREKKERIPSAGTPFTSKAVRIVRALLSDRQKNWSQAELVNRTGLSQGYVSLTLKKLSAEGYVGVHSGKISLLDSGHLLDDWAMHYRFDRHRQKKYAFNASSYDEGLRKLGNIFNDAKLKYAFTGWSAAHLRAPYGIAALWMAYVESDVSIPEGKSLYPVPEGGNLILLQPQDVGVFQFGIQVGGLNIVSDAQLFVDLKKMPGRAAEQADVVRQKYLA
ncbi:MAG: hypothetical protein A2293_03475 [Elusimicrobia bacterium RIFOXYB2_FULL_49_7]|nr:MAG: hypothetical protein A2293_03475 [Elusimicrobia bacterium RIFOXYB2_FULL_49_7]